MNKWTFRLIGLCVVVTLSVILFKSWFFPKEIPLALQKEISIQMKTPPVSSENPAITQQSPTPTEKPSHDSSGDKPPSPPITLISYRDENTAQKEESNMREAKEQTLFADRPKPTPLPPTTIVKKIPAQPEVVIKAENQSPPPQVEITEKEENVKPEPAPLPKPEPKKIARSTPRGGNWVQAGAFSSQENTRNFVARLKRKSWPVTTEDAVVNGKLVHRVLIGPLSPTHVEEYINILGKMGFNARQVSR